MNQGGAMQTSWHSYPSIFNVGHRKVQDIFQDEVLIEEKVDGSQFSFGRFDWVDTADHIKCKSKGAEINPQFPEGMFKLGVDYVLSIAPMLQEGWTYRGEYMAKPKHNSLCYDRIPKNNIILFDINPSEEAYLSYEEKVAEAFRIGFECVPLLYRGKVDDPDQLIKLLDHTSVLGGQKIEGFVIKNYNRFTEEKKAMMGKYVSEAFKEVHSKEWKVGNPSQIGIVELLILKYRTPARWDKSIIHLREAGKLEGSPKDIGFLIKEVGEDIKKECEDQIKTELFDWAWNKIRRGVVSGLPEHYKEKLMRESFSKDAA